MAARFCYFHRSDTDSGDVASRTRCYGRHNALLWREAEPILSWVVKDAELNGTGQALYPGLKINDGY